jgi:hypothetical protein
MASSSRTVSLTTAASPGRERTERARIEHRLRQIDRLMMQDSLTPTALRVLDAEKRSLLAELAPPVLSRAG